MTGQIGFTMFILKNGFTFGQATVVNFLSWPHAVTVIWTKHVESVHADCR